MHTTPRSDHSRPQRAMVTRALLAMALFGVPAAGQQPAGVKRDTGSVARLFAADLSAYANNSGAGTWMQVTPDVVWTTSRLSIAGSLPVYYLNAASTVDGLRAVWGIGDALLGTTLDFSGDSGTAYVTATGGFPTGDMAKGFGAGKFTWDLTGVLGMQLGRLGPYLNAGVSNNAHVVGEAQSVGIGSGKLVPGQGRSNLIHLESGLELDLGHSVSLTGSAYGMFASVVSSTTATPATPLPRRGPRGRLLPPAAKTQAVDDASDASDHGIGGALWGQLTESLGLGLWLSHSIRFSVTTVSLSANVSFAAPGGRNRPHQ